MLFFVYTFIFNQILTSNIYKKYRLQFVYDLLYFLDFLFTVWTKRGKHCTKVGIKY